MSGLLNKNKAANQSSSNNDPLRARIAKLKDAYDTKSPNCRFTAIFYDIKPDKAKPAAFQSLELQQFADSTNPDPKLFMPTQVSGFEELRQRVESQKAALVVFKDKLKDLKGKIQNITEKNLVLNDKIQEITAKDNQIQLTLMSVLKHTEVKALSNIPLSSEEQVLLGDLQKQAEEIEKPNQFVAELNTLSLKAKQKRDSKEMPLRLDLEPEVLQKAEAVLRIDHNAIEALVEFTKKIDQSVQVMEEMNLE